MKFNALFILMLGIGSLHQAHATNYYISSTGADNSNTGLSPSQSWRTTVPINNSDLNPGDSVLFKSGDTINGAMYLTAQDAGTPTQPIYFGTYNGTARANLVVSDSDGFLIQDAGGIVIMHLNFVGNGLTSPVGLSGVSFFNNSQIQGTKISYVFIKDISVSGFRGTALAFWGFSDGSGWKDVTILNSSFFGNGEAGIYTNGSVIQGPNSTVIDYAHKNFRISYCDASHNDGVPTVTDRHTGNGIVMRKIAGLIVDHCQASYNGGSNPYLFTGPSGIWTTQCRDVLFEYNESHHNQTRGNTDGGGFDFDGGTSNGLMQYNYSHDNDGSGYLVAQFGTATRMDTTIFRYNVSQNDGRKNNYGSFNLWSEDDNNGGVDYCYFYNNIAYIKKSPAPWGYNACVLLVSPFMFKTYFMNNVFYSEIGQMSNTIYRPDIKFMGNCYLAPRGVKRNFSFGGRIYDRLDSLQSNGIERWLGVDYGVFTDTSKNASYLDIPGFGNAPTVANPDSLMAVLGRHYKLGPNSPLRDAGFDTRNIAVPNPSTKDFFGNLTTPFLGTAPNIGIDESIATIGFTELAKNKATQLQATQQNNQILVDYKSDYNQHATLQLIDGAGKVIATKNVFLSAIDQNNLSINKPENIKNQLLVVQLTTARGLVPTAKIVAQ